MRFEKINEFVMKVEITEIDLIERNIAIQDLAYGKTNIRNLFNEMLVEGFHKCDFKVDNYDLLVEVTPMSENTLEVIISKVTGEEESVKLKKDIIKSIESKRKEIRNKRGEREDIKKTDLCERQEILMIKIENIDNLCNSTIRAVKYFNGKSKLYKYEDDYYLSLDLNSNKIKVDKEKIFNIFNEFGSLEGSIKIKENFFEEHGKIVIKKDAIKKLSKI